MRVGALRFRQQRAVHVCMATRFEHEGTAEVVLMLAGPGAALEHRAALRGRPAGRDEPERFAGRVGVDRA